MRYIICERALISFGTLRTARAKCNQLTPLPFKGLTILVGCCFRLMFSVYVFFMALVLFNLLIAMMTNRYERAKRRAECIWRFNAVKFGLLFEGIIATAAKGLTGRRLFRSRCYPDETLPRRYLLKVWERTPPMTTYSEQQRLHEYISRLNRGVYPYLHVLTAKLRRRQF